MAKKPVMIIAFVFLLAGCGDAIEIIESISGAAGESKAPPPVVANTSGVGSLPATGLALGDDGDDSNGGGEGDEGGVDDAAASVQNEPALAEDALAAAFALARQRQNRASTVSDAILDDDGLLRYPVKTGFRIALVLPRDDNSGVSREIRNGAELAMFALAPENTDMVLVDSADSIGLDAAEADIVLGPLFSQTTIALKEQMATATPVISFSNDTSVAAITDGVYIIGRTPEAEVAAALGHAMNNSGAVTPRVAILSSERNYGMRVAEGAMQYLAARGMAPVARYSIPDEVLADQTVLAGAIMDFTGAVTNYDILVFAGDIGFALAVAPVLAWHDIDTGVVDFVGPSLWGEPAILQEPSLDGGIFARPPEDREAAFGALAEKSGIPSPGRYGALGFDAVALAVNIAESPDKTAAITRAAGFGGFSGVFRFERGGGNARLLDVHEITDGESRLIAPAARGF